MSRDEIYERAYSIIRATREKLKLLFDAGYIKRIPEEIEKLIVKPPVQSNE